MTETPITPPHNRDAEVGLLGAVLRDPDVRDEALAGLRPEDFYYDAHQRVFRAVAAVAAAGRPVDLVSVGEAVSAVGAAADIGGLRYLADLWEAAPTSANAAYHAALVREKAALRGLARAAAEAGREALEGLDHPAEIAARLARACEDVGEPRGTGPVPMEAAVAGGVRNLLDRRARGGLSFGLCDLDALIPSLEPERFFVVAARTGVGKTALGVTLGLKAAHLYGVPTLYASAEMSADEIGERMALQLTGLSGHLFRTGRATPDEVARLQAAVELARGNPLEVLDRPGLKVRHVAAEARRLKRRRGLGLVVVDYLQLIEPDDRRASRREQVEQISRDLKRLARELKVPLVAAAQVNREAENREGGRPRLSDLREAGGIEQDADVVILLWRHPGQPDDAQEVDVGCDVAKQRNGPTGEVTLRYRRPCMRFEDRTPIV